MAQYDDLNGRRIATVGVISVIVTAVTALAVQVAFYAMASYTDAAKQAASDYRRQNNVLNEQARQVGSFGVDPATGNITIPVEDAMRTLVDDKKDRSVDEKKTDTKEEI